MKTVTITISIQVPDDATVSPVRPAQSAQPARPFVLRPDPPYPGGECPEHGEEWRLVPAGVSRKLDADGNPKRYNSFWACPIRGCNERPPRPGEGESYVEDVTEPLPF